MRDEGITNGARLRVSIHPSNPEIFTIFVTLLNGTQITLNMAEVINTPCRYSVNNVRSYIVSYYVYILSQKQVTSELYRQVKQKISSDKTFKLKFGTITVPDDGTTLYSSICDGAQLVARIPVWGNLYINIQKDCVTIRLPEVS